MRKACWGLGSSGTCLDGVRDVIGGYCGTWLEGLIGVIEGY